MTCEQSFRIVGPCSACGKYIDGSPDNQAHLLDGRHYCEGCCAYHKPVPVKEWGSATPKTVEGKQDTLF